MTAAAASAAKAAAEQAKKEEEEAALVEVEVPAVEELGLLTVLDVDELGSISCAQLCDADARAAEVAAAEAAPPAEDTPAEAPAVEAPPPKPAAAAAPSFGGAKPVSGASPEGELLKNDEGRTVVLGTGARSSGGGGLFASSNWHTDDSNSSVGRILLWQTQHKVSVCRLWRWFAVTKPTAPTACNANRANASSLS